MQAARVYSTDVEANQRLAELFQLVCSDFYPVIEAVAAGRADITEDDPLGAGGQFAYIYGVRHTRALMRRKQWQRHREENIESVKHPDKDLWIVYQSVDSAAKIDHDPRAISGKGSGADRVVDAAQGTLFSNEELDRLNSAKVATIRKAVWFFCVSVNGDDVRAELSLPASLGASNFDQFIERIFIVRQGEWGSLKGKPVDGGDAVELEPIVTRK